jgi:hypothetical protein
MGEKKQEAETMVFVLSSSLAQRQNLYCEVGRAFSSSLSARTLSAYEGHCQ